MRAQLVAVISIFALPHDVNTAAGSPNETPKRDADPLISKFPKFVEWFRRQGGFIDDRVTIGYEPGSNIRGMITTADIPAKTEIMHIPKSLIIGGVDWCQDFETIKKEMDMGPLSKWFDYFDFDDSSGSRLPLEWDRSDEPGSARRELQGLTPDDFTHRHIDWFEGDWGCLGGKEMISVFDFQAFKIYLTRSMNLGLMPMYDLMNHHNGKINTYIERDAKRGGVSVLSLVDIPAGFPIYNTYSWSGTKSTNDLFGQYGFVEDYPQLWQWNDSELERYRAYHRYVTTDNNDVNLDENPNHLGKWNNKLNFEHNSPFYEVLVISPTVAALLPTKHLTGVLGNGQLSLEGWRSVIDNHHATLRSSHVDALCDNAMRTLNSLPTTIEQDEKIIRHEKLRLKRLKEFGIEDANAADVVMAIEFRLAFKKALRLTMDVATQEREAFFKDTEVATREREAFDTDEL
ncbi:hypothetical protein ACHAW5_010203 [Stephanodiscus triporus]|uniref:SET domain-containing protein n=1 Tax=Stephanodiscus triporus TaxID=2934178 RepID=A0ABD3NFH7_9STRA